MCWPLLFSSIIDILHSKKHSVKCILSTIPHTFHQSYFHLLPSVSLELISALRICFELSGWKTDLNPESRSWSGSQQKFTQYLLGSTPSHLPRLIHISAQIPSYITSLKITQKDPKSKCNMDMIHPFGCSQTTRKKCKCEPNSFFWCLLKWGKVKSKCVSKSHVHNYVYTSLELLRLQEIVMEQLTLEESVQTSLWFMTKIRFACVFKLVSRFTSFQFLSEVFTQWVTLTCSENIETSQMKRIPVTLIVELCPT